MRQFAAWATGLRQRLASRLIKAVFAEEILGEQKAFIANVAHELRTPLSVIKTSSEVALFDPALSRDARKTFVEIVGELTRVSEILDNLLSLNALAGGERMALQNLDVGAIVEGAAKRLVPLARERRIRMSVRARPGSIALGNRAALETAVHHLIKNALLFTPASEDGVVAVRVRPEGSSTVIEVRDNGIGMSRDDLLHAAEPFYRADVSRHRAIKQTGSGLGLTIAHEMVRLHGGTLTLESKRREGTVATVALPRGGFIPATGAEEYTNERLARSDKSESGAHEPYHGRRHLTEDREVI